MRKNEHPLILGLISGVYGVRGWLKLNSYTRPKENILSYSPLLMKVDKDWQELDVEETQLRGGRLLLKINGVATPEQAQEFIHRELAVTQDQLPPLSEGEYYWHDLIGLEVLNQDEISLGKVKQIAETGANDVLVINGEAEGKSRILIPLIMDVYVKQVDLIAKTIHVDWQLEE